MRKYIISALALFAAAGIVLCPGELSASVRSSVSGCLEVVIPALFAFTVLAVYLQKSGLYRTALRPVTKPFSLLLGIPEELCAVFLLANIGGYPVGARLLTVMVKTADSAAEAPRSCCAAATVAVRRSSSALRGPWFSAARQWVGLFTQRASFRRW